MITEPKPRRLLIIAGATLGSIALIACLIILAFLYAFGAPEKDAKPEMFIVSLNANSKQAVVQNLYDKGFIKHKWAIKYALNFEGAGDTIQPGGYEIGKDAMAFGIATALTDNPAMRWITIPEGWRKEQIAELLASTLGWEPKAKNIWVNNLTAMKFDYVEGVYFPDTYLIPVDEAPSQIADRLRARFEEKFALYSKEAMDQNIKWTTAIKLASIVQREAGGKGDMPLIAGILWNRLLQDTKLEVDATIQYARDSKLAYEEDPCEDPNSYARVQNLCYRTDLLQPTVAYIGIQDWWKPITPGDIQQLDSFYNTYKYKGLPPHPIGNPGLDAIEAVLRPAETECLYYLHDNNRQIHCAKTYEEHQKNIDQYLK